MSNDVQHRIEHALFDNAHRFHTSVRPYQWQQLDTIISQDSLYAFSIPARRDYSQRTGFGRFLANAWYNLKHDDLWRLEHNRVTMRINPLMHFAGGAALQEKQATFYNTRGLQLNVDVGKVRIQSRFLENQAQYPRYIQQFIDQPLSATSGVNGNVAPGQGAARSFVLGGYDFAYADGYINYSPDPIFNIELGQGKHFIGDGYRSLLLSDNTFNYPYLKLEANFWHIKYWVLYNQMIYDVGAKSLNFDRGYPRKYGTFHYLSWDFDERFQLGLFEAIIWKGADSTQQTGFELSYLNPILFLRPVEFAQGSPDNALLGINFSFKMRAHRQFYAQVMIDDIDITNTITTGRGLLRNKLGLQLGFKALEAFKVQGLRVQSELNVVRPYAYNHKRLSAQSYTHYNQALAHPLGANFVEGMLLLSYRKGRWTAESQLQLARQGLDSDSIYNGANVFRVDSEVFNFREDFGNTVGQGIPRQLMHTEWALRYLVNPKTNLNFELRLIQRFDKVNGNSNGLTWFHVGLKTDLDNFYLNF